MDLNTDFGTKELYNVVLKATFPMKVGNRQYVTGEPVLRFDQIQMGIVDSTVSRSLAQGGKGNIPQIIWENMSEVRFQFSRGTFSTLELAIAGNSSIISSNTNPTLVPYSQTIESDSHGVINLRYTPIYTEPFFVRKEDGTAVSFVGGDGAAITIAPFTKVIVDYYFSYTSGYQTLEVGKELFNGYLRLEGRMRVKEEISGENHTGLLVVPKLKVASGIHLRLGENMSPMVNTFYAAGYPAGDKGEKTICSITFLDEDIDV